MFEVCGDNRFEVIAEYKKKLIEGTNIESCPKEMAVIDSILFRFWQMGWIPAADVEPKRKTGRWIDVYVSNPARMRTMCSECGMFSGIGGIPSNRHKPYCPNCGSPMLPEPPKEEDDGEVH